MNVKPDACAECDAELAQPATGRPRTYCSAPCRRMAERRIKVAEQLLVRARREEQSARARVLVSYNTDGARKLVKFWGEEIARCEAELAALLRGAAAGDEDSDEAEASAAAATLSSRRRAS